MSTEPTETEESPLAEAPEANETGWDPDRARAALEKKNREAQNLRQRLKELEQKTRELEQRDPLKQLAEVLGKPEEAKGEDLAATVKELKQQFEAERLRALRLEVAAAKGLTPKQAERLRGATREELEADADDLLESFATKASTKSEPSTPAPDPTQGARGSANDLDARIAAAEAKGRAGVRELLRLKEEKAAQMAAGK